MFLGRKKVSRKCIILSAYDFPCTPTLKENTHGFPNCPQGHINCAKRLFSLYYTYRFLQFYILPLTYLSFYRLEFSLRGVGRLIASLHPWRSLARCAFIPISVISSSSDPAQQTNAQVTLWCIAPGKSKECRCGADMWAGGNSG